MGQRVKGSSGGVWRAKESGGGSPVRGYIHGDSARCAVTGRLDVERLAASRTIFIVASDTLLVPRFWKPEVPASTYSHLVAQSASRFPTLQLLSVGPSVQTLCERERDRSEGRREKRERAREKEKRRQCREILQRPAAIIRADSVEQTAGYRRVA